MIGAEEALGLYERNWCLVETDKLDDEERNLLEQLVEKFGNGVFIGAGIVKSAFSKQDCHSAILSILRSIDGEFLAGSKCFLSGGTAIPLCSEGYRKSPDIDFLCSDRDGFRALRTALAGKPNLDGILRLGETIETVRDIRADRYGLKTVVRANGIDIKIEIVLEARIELDGALDSRLGVPVLSRELMYAEKLLANSDRWQDPAALSEDILDLSVMISRWGWHIAEEAYGPGVRDDFAEAVKKIRDLDWIGYCVTQMEVDEACAEGILQLHDRPGVAGRSSQVLSDLERFRGRLPASARLSRDQGNER
ncbi:nucleotidyl transferase AbiEii/AbiGii toxin family protein [Citreimonas salinaria]|uniref:nucleotidyl transferase AbiEii/AbiGii toxin family protein n=1 Tax=Citreimonas salinaria TaxID=321339 RepID=UPI0015A69403|nr:nucleotidyl transferase AbiEii/AbiGii toxin family protein [Citreimonas salinaria]